jgi:hypothetical protein
VCLQGASQVMTVLFDRVGGFVFAAEQRYNRARH